MIVLYDCEFVDGDNVVNCIAQDDDAEEDADVGNCVAGAADVAVAVNVAVAGAATEVVVVDVVAERTKEY